MPGKSKGKLPPFMQKGGEKDSKMAPPFKKGGKAPMEKGVVKPKGKGRPY